MDVQEAIEKLKASPLFYLFAASRELFHTNFWYWLYTLNAREAARLFGVEAREGDKVEFIREYCGNGVIRNGKKYNPKIDIAVKVNGRLVLVIENKVKDFATASQLDYIKQSTVETGVKYLLVTLFYNDIIRFDGWDVLIYKDLAHLIDCNKFCEGGYYKELIEDYKTFTLNLVALAELLEINETYDFAISNNRGLYQLIDKIIWDGFQRLRGNHMVRLFKEKYPILPTTPVVNINNRKATIHFPIELGNGYRIGIQIEDLQFRKFVSGPKPLKFAQTVYDAKLFFDDNSEHRKREKFLRYDPDFRYQYVKLKKEMPYDELFSLIKKEFEYIEDNFDNIKKCIPV